MLEALDTLSVGWEKYRYLYQYFSVSISIDIFVWYRYHTNFIEIENILKLILDTYEINTYLFEGQEVRKDIFTNLRIYMEDVK